MQKATLPLLWKCVVTTMLHVAAASEYCFVLWQVGTNLVVLNLSQQTDSADLLGGFQPVEPRHALLPLLDRFQVCSFCYIFTSAQSQPHHEGRSDIRHFWTGAGCPSNAT